MVKSVGVLLDPDLVVEKQVATVTKMHSQLHLHHQLSSWTLDNLAALVHAIVTSRLDYGNTLLPGSVLKAKQTL